MKMNVSLIGHVSQRLTACLIGAALFGACAATTPPGGAEEPASAAAPTAAEPSGSPSLAPEAAHGDHAGHDSAGHDSAGHDSAGHDHADHGAVAPAADVYTCPMHPEVRQNEPGRCSKCGMNLEKAQTDEKSE